MFMIVDTDNNSLLRLVFETPMAAAHYNQRFGEPSWRVIAVDLMSLDEVRALPSHMRRARQSVEVGIDGGL